MIEIVPAIDIIDGQCVRLSQGDYDKKTIYATNPEEMARIYAGSGMKRIHVVDLDGAKVGKPCNIDVLRRISELNIVSVEWGGGIKSEDDIGSVFNAGANHAIIGSVSVSRPMLMQKWLDNYGGDKVILGADLRNGYVAVHGWLEDSTLTVDDLIEYYLPFGLKEIIVTDISKDGMLKGPSFRLYEQLKNNYPDIIITVSGGISSMDDIKRLDAMGLDRVIVGKAIYENRISLSEISDFIKNCN